MGERYVTPPVISFEAIFEQSTPYSPIIFILSPGSDPAGDLMKLAERSGFGVSKLKYLAMGQGQEKVFYLLVFIFLTFPYSKLNEVFFFIPAFIMTLEGIASFSFFFSVMFLFPTPGN